MTSDVDIHGKLDETLEGNFCLELLGGEDWLSKFFGRMPVSCRKGLVICPRDLHTECMEISKTSKSSEQGPEQRRVNSRASLAWIDAQHPGPNEIPSRRGKGRWLPSGKIATFKGCHICHLSLMKIPGFTMDGKAEIGDLSSRSSRIQRSLAPQTQLISLANERETEEVQKDRSFAHVSPVLSADRPVGGWVEEGRTSVEYRYACGPRILPDLCGILCGLGSSNSRLKYVAMI